jgi:ABC-type Fe3+/spermidine/putrescine transport system ATPase subunit
MFQVDSLFVPDAKWITIRPEKIRFGKVNHNTLKATITDVCDYGVYKEYQCQIDSSLVLVVRRPESEPSPPKNSTINLHLSPQHVMLLNDDNKALACFDEKRTKTSNGLYYLDKLAT